MTELQLRTGHRLVGAGVLNLRRIGTLSTAMLSIGVPEHLTRSSCQGYWPRFLRRPRVDRYSEVVDGQLPGKTAFDVHGTERNNHSTRFESAG